MIKAKISEIFRSLQGEGKYVGVAQVFVRFFGCRLSCRNCDTPQGKEPSYGFKEYTARGLLKAVLALSKGVHSISLTGGEPLEQSACLESFLPLLKAEGHRTYLETNGILFKELQPLIGFLDIIAMDMKLPSATGGKIFWEDHARFLAVAKKRDVFVKAVITLDTALKDVGLAAKLASDVNRGIVFILQPNHCEWSKDLFMVCQKAHKIARKYLDDVRIIPQMHKQWGIR